MVYTCMIYLQHFKTIIDKAIPLVKYGHPFTQTALIVVYIDRAALLNNFIWPNTRSGFIISIMSIENIIKELISLSSICNAIGFF